MCCVSRGAVGPPVRSAAGTENPLEDRPDGPGPRGELLNR